MILKCKCKNLYQDSKYGKFMRVHNPMRVSGTKPKTYRCTVCGTIREETK